MTNTEAGRHGHKHTPLELSSCSHRHRRGCCRLSWFCCVLVQDVPSTLLYSMSVVVQSQWTFVSISLSLSLSLWMCCSVTMRPAVVLRRRSMFLSCPSCSCCVVLFVYHPCCSTTTTITRSGSVSNTHSLTHTHTVTPSLAHSLSHPVSRFVGRRRRRLSRCLSLSVHPNLSLSLSLFASSSVGAVMMVVCRHS